MSQESKKDILPKCRQKYRSLKSKKYRSEYLDTFCTLYGYERKYAQKILSGVREGCGRGRKSKSGRKRKYTDEHKAVLKWIWLQSDQPCGRRMHGSLGAWVNSYCKHVRRLERECIDRLDEISSAQIDRIISEFRVSEQRNGDWRNGRGNTAVKAAIPVRAETWKVDEPGWMEGDCVTLCGGNMEGCNVWILTLVDVAFGWTEIAPMWNRSAKKVIDHYGVMEQRCPFAFKGIDTDNGGEFINYEAIKWQQMKKIMGEEVVLTRSRPYHKNDQAYVEQKNFTHVREFFGYERYGHQQLMDSMDELCQAWSLYNNLYRPIMKQISCYREGTKLKRRHEKKAMSPAQRLIAYKELDGGVRLALEQAIELNDPFELRQECERGLAQIWQMIKEMDKYPQNETGKDSVAAKFGKLNLHYAPIELAKLSCL